ncbi:Retrovirus-related Pol polyprotein from transposon 17.6 [Nosema granulosis]|uniref:RNA-directed DNA polymerase n=1 Tax=Nosema granulosis TaxID=83296 RepID=A0A9P6GVD2_9MICR|nr:Retrovirus-related Pol polyprotein from transposon 17.6 [Nosema granulosis]
MLNKSLLELYLKQGEIPGGHRILNSIAQETAKNEKKLGEDEFLEIELKVAGTEMKFKKKMQIIKRIEDLDIASWFKEFEKIAIQNGWNNEQILIILRNLITDERINEDIFSTDIITTKKNLIKEIYNGDVREILAEAFKIFQINYVLIEDFYQEIYNKISLYSCYYEISKAEFNRHISEVFLNGLGINSKLEISRHNLKNDVVGIVNHLREIEKVLLKDLNKMKKKDVIEETKTTESELRDKRNLTGKGHSEIRRTYSNKWCSIHKNSTHNTKECYYNKSNDTRGQVTNFTRREEPYNKRENDNCNLLVEPIIEIKTVELEGEIEGREVKFILDTGASKNFINEELVKELKLIKKEDKMVTTLFANSEQESTDKTVSVKIRIKGIENELWVRMYILQKSPKEIILGNEFLYGNDAIINYKTGFVKLNDKKTSFIDQMEKCKLDELIYEKVNMIIDECKDVQEVIALYKKNNENFSKIKLNRPETITYDKNLKGYECKPYSIALGYKERLKEELRRLEAEDIIERCNSKFSSPAFVVEKKNKNVRLVIDYSYINKYIQDEITYIPKIHENLLVLGRNEYYSTIDLKNGFYQIEIEETSRGVTGFYILGKHYQFKRLPFGIKPGPKMFQKNIARILEDIDNVFVYIDDIVVFGKSKLEHDLVLTKVLKRLYEAEVKINFDKSSFGKEEIEILGRIVNKDGIKANLGNFPEEILNKEPKTIRELQKILGVVNWFRSFVPKMSTELNNVTNLLRNKDTRRIIWTQQHREELNKVVKLIKQNITLVSPDLTKKFILQCDACETGMGAVLIQEHGIIGFYSKKFLSSELNYTIVEKELYAIVLGLEEFKNLIQGQFIRIETDSRNCTFLNRKISTRIERWKILLNEFNFELVNIKGEDNTMADTLSRCFSVNDYEFTKDEYNRKVKQFVMCEGEGGHKVFQRDNQNRIIIAEDKKEEFIKFAHEISGHVGITLLYYNLKDYFYIRGVRRLLEKVCKTCRLCLECKGGTNIKINNEEIQSEKKMEKLSTDIFGPFYPRDCLDERVENKYYFLTITDIYSRFTRIYYGDKFTGKEVKKCFERWVNEFESPKAVISDNGTQYCSKIVKEYFQEKDVRQIFIPPYHPQSNGISERVNLTIAEVLRIYKGKEIKTIKDIAEHRINNNVNTTLGVSPREIIFRNSFYDLDSIEKDEWKPKMINHSVKTKLSNILRLEDCVYVKTNSTNKMDRKYQGPMTVETIGEKGKWVKLRELPHWVHISQLKF